MAIAALVLSAAPRAIAQETGAPPIGEQPRRPYKAIRRRYRVAFPLSHEDPTSVDMTIRGFLPRFSML
jgi:hypothetical protein